MLKGIFSKKLFSFFGGLRSNPSERSIKLTKRTIAQINSLEQEILALSDDELRGRTSMFQAELAKGTKLDDILPQAFATVREAARRTRGMRHFDVQMVGGIVMHQGKVAEMRTGEGKTLAATLPSYLNALSGKGVHVVTVNDYLAKRDAEWMGKIHEFLGLNVAYIAGGMSDHEKRQAYAADITYCVNNELGFDYLRDNLKYQLNQLVMREQNYAIIDEVDSVLIDEARTPLIISGRPDGDPEFHNVISKIISGLEESDYEVDEKLKTVLLKDEGILRIEDALRELEVMSDDGSGLYDLQNMGVVHYIDQALKAHKLFKKDVDYLVKDKKIYIIDEFTGRVMEGRRYSEGLHQAIEAKEHVPIQYETQTIASITPQNFFRGYKKLAGMTGTAKSDALEFRQIYGLDIVTIPTHLPVARQDKDDLIYRTAEEKYEAILSEIDRAHAKKQPVLIGTVSIKQSEHISQLLKKKKLKHKVLNAKFHETEAMVIAQAGQPGGITVATNMAGRGTDIMLGGNAEMLAAEKVQKLGNAIGDDSYQQILSEFKEQVTKDRETVLSAGGLYVIGTERHESRRIDNQLRGRSGRQGDIGETQFFLSLEDDLMRIFGSERISNLLLTLGLKHGEAIVHPWVSKAVEKAQQKVEHRNYDIRKNLLQFDDVTNVQRQVIYAKRMDILKDSSALLNGIIDTAADIAIKLVDRLIPEGLPIDDWDLKTLNMEIVRIYNMHLPIDVHFIQANPNRESLSSYIAKECTKILKDKLLSYDGYEEFLQQMFLFTMDQLWQEHIVALERMRMGVNLRAYAQKDPLNEYKREAFDMFKEMLDNIGEQIVVKISHIHLQQASNLEEDKHQVGKGKIGKGAIADILVPKFKKVKGEVPIMKNAGAANVAEVILDSEIKRNDPCPCGSGKKYKHCHGAVSQ